MSSITAVRSFAETPSAPEAESGVSGQPGPQTTGIWDYATQSSPQSSGGISGVMSGHPIIEDPGDWRRHNDVSLLDQAEALAQDAFRRVSPFNSNASPADKLKAQQEMQQAEQIRNQVEPDLDPAQRQALEQIKSEEKQAFTDATSVGGGFLGDIHRGFAPTKMIDGANRSKALDNSILGVTQTPPPLPILSPPFGRI